MDLRKIIHELEIEKQRVDEAIMALERLSTGSQTSKATLRKSLGNSRETSVHEAHTEPPAASVPAH